MRITCDTCNGLMDTKIVSESGEKIAILTCRDCGNVEATDKPETIELVEMIDSSVDLPDDRAQREEVEDDCAGALAALQERVDQLEGERKNPVDREFLGQLVQRTWHEWQKKQPTLWSNWLLEWDDVDDDMKESARLIGEKVASAACARLFELEDKTLEAEQRADKAETALHIAANYLPRADLHGPGELCKRCSKATLGECGPGVKDSEPCEAFGDAEDRYNELAPVREIIDR